MALKEGCESTAVYFDGSAIKKAIIWRDNFYPEDKPGVPDCRRQHHSAAQNSRREAGKLTPDLSTRSWFVVTFKTIASVFMHGITRNCCGAASRPNPTDRSLSAGHGAICGAAVCTAEKGYLCFFVLCPDRNDSQNDAQQQTR
ncbi:MAG: hypothetical protein PHO66_01080 [Eubacteriales bacterium]|nr:hypothetical protein [Eubacteriales bacterium]